MAPHLFVSCGSFGFQFSAFGFRFCPLASCRVPGRLFYVVCLCAASFCESFWLACAAESCHKQISCRNKPEPGYICSDLRDSLLHMVITETKTTSHNSWLNGGGGRSMNLQMCWKLWCVTWYPHISPISVVTLAPTKKICLLCTFEKNTNSNQEGIVLNTYFFWKKMVKYRNQ